MSKQLSIVKISLALIFILLSPMVALSQGTIAAYQRAESFNGLIQNKIYNAPNNFQWLKNRNQFFYSMLTERGNEFYVVGIKDLIRKEAFDQQKLATALSIIAKQKLIPYRLPITSVTINKLTNCNLTSKAGNSPMI